MSTRLELDPGASVGYHKHAGTEEVYFIMAGKGLYTERGGRMPGTAERCLSLQRGAFSRHPEYR